jgi:hypothetical protein
MTRGLSGTFTTAADRPVVRPIMFFQLVFDSGTVRIHNGVGTFTWGGFTWTGMGALGDVGPLEEGLDLSPFALRITLNGLDPTLVGLALNESIFDRALTIYLGLLDASGQLIEDPHVRWEGMMDHINVTLGNENALELQCEDDLRFFDRANGSLFTDEHQQSRYPGDKFFEYLDQLVDAQIIWGPDGATNRLGVPITPRGPVPRPGTPRNPNTALR